MLDLSKVKENDELRLAVKALSTAFPNCSISTDSRESLDDALPMIVTIIGIIKERKEDLRCSIGTFPIVVRWAFWYACILAVVFFGAYGTGYTMVDLIYAGY